MIALARWIIRLSAWLAPRADRARLTEEWLAELDAVCVRGGPAALRFALGAPPSALAHRSATREGGWSTREPGRLFSAVGGDVQYAWRQMVRRKAHTVSVIACLVAGLAVSIGTFSVLNSLLTGDQPGIHGRPTMARLYIRYDDAAHAELVGRRRVTADRLTLGEFSILSSTTFPAASALASVGAEGTMPMTISGDHGPVAVAGAFVSGDYFDTLHTERGPAGRLIQAHDDVSGAAPVAVVSEHFWRSHLNARQDAIGKPILIAGFSFTLAGVAPARFHGLIVDDLGGDDSQGTQVWVPMFLVSRWPSSPPNAQRWLSAIARVKPGRLIADGERELSMPSVRIAAAFPTERANAMLLARPQGFSPDTSSSEIATAVFMIMLLPLTVLAIGCANVANLQLARVAERSRELAVRLSLGASRGQLIRLLTFETLARALVAVALALGVVRLLMRYFEPLFTVFLSIDWRVALFATALALVVALGTGLMPAWLVLRKTAAGQLRQSAQSGGLGHTRLRATLIVLQVGLSLALLTTATLIVRTTREMAASAPPALREQVVASFNPGTTGMTPDEGRRFADTIAERAAADGRVRGVALSWATTLDFGPPRTPGKDQVVVQSADFIGVSPSWFGVMDVKLLTGRRLTSADDDQVALLSARAAEMIAPAGTAVGETLNVQVGPHTSRQVRVVGIVADNPTEPRVSRPGPVIYTVLPKTFNGEFLLRIRTSATDAVSAGLPKLVASIDPRIASTSVRRGDMRFEDSARDIATVALAVGATGTVALILSATGLFAVMSYVVMLRRREIGVRLAIGADPARIVALVMRQAIGLITIGAAAGMAIAVPIAFVMRAEFTSSVNPGDPMIFAPALALLFGVGAISAVVPALRASRVDPISTLRQD